MTKDLLFFKGELAPSRDKYHMVFGGNLLILFDKNKSEILPGHDKVIREKVVDFLVRAVRAIGPDDYNLSVLGMASATGPHEYNSELAGKRAYNSAICAIRHFEKLQAVDPTLKGATVNPVTNVLSDDLSRVDAKLLHLKQGQIDHQQGFFRSAVFKFSAGRSETHVKHPPSFVCSGPEAVRRARELLETSEPEMMPFPSQWGSVVVKKGQIWGETKRLIVSADWQHITYLEGDTLWSAPTADFAREILLDGFIEGMKRAKPIAEMTKVVMSFIQGVLVGPLVAIAAKLIVLFMWAGAHPDLVDKGVDAARPAFRGLKYINEKCPTLWGKMLDKMEDLAAKEAVAALKETVTKPENIAFCLGRILRGIGGLDKLFAGKEGPAKKLVTITIGKILFVTIECAVLVALLHLPEGYLEVGKEKVKDLAKRLQEDFKTKDDIQILLNETEANLIAQELLQPGVKQEFERMKIPLQNLEKLLRTYIDDMAELE